MTLSLSHLPHPAVTPYYSLAVSPKLYDRNLIPNAIVLISGTFQVVRALPL